MHDRARHATTESICNPLRCKEAESAKGGWGSRAVRRWQQVSAHSRTGRPCSSLGQGGESQNKPSGSRGPPCPLPAGRGRLRPPRQPLPSPPRSLSGAGPRPAGGSSGARNDRGPAPRNGPNGRRGAASGALGPAAAARRAPPEPPAPPPPNGPPEGTLVLGCPVQSTQRPKPSRSPPPLAGREYPHVPCHSSGAVALSPFLASPRGLSQAHRPRTLLWLPPHTLS